ncbi:C-C chemokine receptor type 4 [Centroberyx affinis]|uniref:C-C chemokine receptor type 4 n=1 Tax=Centroberyx affinis TaxID=166261 RepID=UPI003A5B9FB6
MATTIAALVGTVRENSSTEYGSTQEPFSEITTNYAYWDYSNISDDELGRCVYDSHPAHYLPALYSVFFIVGLLGNTLVIWVIVCGARLRSMTDVCLLNLAFADLLLVCSFPFLAHQARDQWLFGDGMCKAVLGAYYIGFYSGIFFITLMSIDRYLAIVHAVYALRARTRSFGILAATVTWVAAITASFPDLSFLEVQESRRKDGEMYKFCAPLYSKPGTLAPGRHFWSVFSLFKMNVLGLLIPMAIMGFCYTHIIRRLLCSQSSKKQAIRLVLVVVAVFFCCWVPYNVTSLFKALELLHPYAECSSSKAIRRAIQATEAVAYSHSCLNPVLYVFVGERFRRHLVRLVKRSPCRLCQIMKTFIPQDRINGSVYSQTTSVDERSTAV